MFGFGKNWRSFSKNALTAERVSQARRDFYKLFNPQELIGRSFLDVGFGQGLSLMLAAECGAQAKGVDIDPYNLEAIEITRRFFPNVPVPTVEIGSILDPMIVDKLSSGGGYDIVHSWGVLHHTGQMWAALRNCATLVKVGGLLAVSVYNKHWSSPYWRQIKRLYNSSPGFIQRGLVWSFYPVILVAKTVVTGSNPFKKERGMDFYYDLIDWVGGYPYEYAYPSEVVRFVEQLGFTTVRSYPASVPTGCNEFVFSKMSA